MKHLVLTTLTRHWNISQDSFTYLDVHAGYPDYQLHNHGAWINGLGSFLEKYHPGLNADLDYFYQLLDLKNLNQHRHYPGSSKLVARCLQDKNINNVQLYLCDTNAEVCQALNDANHDKPGVLIYCEDGYAVARKHDHSDLIFIDPPDMAQQFDDYYSLVSELVAQDRSFVSWNSLHGNNMSNGMSENCLAMQQLARQQGLTLLTMLWQQGWPQTMCGCQMLVSKRFPAQLQQVIIAAAGALSRLMNWHLLNQ